MLTYTTVWAVAVLFSLASLCLRGSDLVSALIWAEITWVALIVLIGVFSITLSDLSLVFVCVVAMCLSAVELAVIIALVSSRVS